jgi:DNA-directed RNA polymerase specialized sigma24 family protein
LYGFGSASSSGQIVPSAPSSRSTAKAKARFATFLYRIAANLCLNELRRFDYSGKIESLDTPDESESGNSSLADRLPDSDSPGPAQRLACREAAIEVKKLLKHLPPNQRMAVLLSRVEGFSPTIAVESASRSTMDRSPSPDPTRDYTRAV